MLKHLSIKNYAIIENIELSFDDGFTVITGETGAGKSILLGALSLILGQRAETSVLNDKEKKCVVEGAFDFEKEKYFEFFEDNDLDFEPINILRREISANGKSRAFINDTPVSLVTLKELTSQLIDIHSQYETLQLQDNKFQINVVDAFAEIEKDVSQYNQNYRDFIENSKRLETLRIKAYSINTDVDYIAFQIKEIEELHLKLDEKEEIQSELRLINNAEEIKSVLETSTSILTNSEVTLLNKLKNIANSFSKIVDCSPEYLTIYERLNTVIIELEDIARDIDRCDSDFAFDAENMSYLTDRLSQIYSIEQKHRVSSIEEIFEVLERLKLQLGEKDEYDEKISSQEKLVDKQKSELKKLAESVSKKRCLSFEGLERIIVDNLGQLGMPNASFKIKHTLLEEVSENGLDKINFLFSSNKGVELKELNKVASGGELSRVMLTIKSILAENRNLSSIIFDEIDSGVSGDIADKMAGIMKKMSRKVQVITITHLAQVAARGEHHFKIYKEVEKDKTLTLLSNLSESDRIEEIAKMLSGEKLSMAARENAKTLMSL